MTLPQALSVADKTVEKFLARAVRLYEPDQGGSSGPPIWIVRGAFGQVGLYRYDLAPPRY